jgi:hypothetical protein
MIPKNEVIEDTAILPESVSHEVSRVGGRIGSDVSGRSYYASSVVHDVERLLAAFHFEDDTFVLRNVAQAACRALTPVIERLSQVSDREVRDSSLLELVNAQMLLSYASEVRDDTPAANHSRRRVDILRTVRIVLDEVRRSLNKHDLRAVAVAPSKSVCAAG